ncbi:serine/alanine racemase [Paenibacillaceae bacterium GAS479]|nr:serine/alanine racemase [Paenibacillaceae bacterium GAS479]
MLNKPKYNGLDWLRLLMGLLVVANHTGPLESYSSHADFLFSGIFTRITVPIFFMVSGFLYFRKLNGDSVHDRKVLYRYLQKIGKLYLIGTILYIPLNLYKGYYTNNFSLYSFMQDVLFNGTFYHLWFLPALMFGVTITTLAYGKMSRRTLIAAASVLFVIGLFGDNYYGLIKNVPMFSNLYDGMFSVFDYTRNGLFFAPIYLVLGAWMATNVDRMKRPSTNICLFILSLGLLFTEGILLKSADTAKHASMYVFALPTAYFLFQLALQWRVKKGLQFREPLVWIFILHIWVVVLVRGAAEAVNLEAIFINNSLIHYIVVCLLSMVLAVGAAGIMNIKRKKELSHGHPEGSAGKQSF